MVDDKNPGDNMKGKPRTEVPTEQRIGKLEDRIHSAEKWMISLTFAIAFFGLCSVVVGILQRISMQGQLNEMKAGSADTKTLALAAKSQAETSEKVRLNTEDFFKREQRPYVWIVKEERLGSPAVGNPFQINVNAKNFGKSPAEYVAHRDVLRLQNSAGDGAGDLTFKAAQAYQVDSKRGTPLPPGDEFFFTVLGQKVTLEMLRDIETQKRFVFIAGYIEYSDSFGDRHKTEFCLHWSSEGHTWNYCDTHNKIE